jgi:dTDP-4-amino-4,6-dideoxygalactose transaminase
LQCTGSYLQKLLGALGLIVVSRPKPYGVLARACSWLGSDLDTLVNSAVRAFPPREQAFFRRLRHQPCSPLLAMLSRRLRVFDGERIARRASAGERFACRMRGDVVHPGGSSLRKTHWLFPVVVADPEAMISGLRERGLDASRATSSIAVVEGPAGRIPAEASQMMSGVVFLPVYPGVSSRAIEVMVDLVNHSTVDEAFAGVAR